MFVAVCHVVGMATRFAPASSGYMVIPNGIQVAEAAGKREDLVSSTGGAQHAVARLALVRHGRCWYSPDVFGGFSYLPTCAEGSERLKDGGDDTKLSTKP